MMLPYELALIHRTGHMSDIEAKAYQRAVRILRRYSPASYKLLLETKVLTMPECDVWAAYNHTLDELTIARDTFLSVEGLATTIYHELVHKRQYQRRRLPGIYYREFEAHTKDTKFWLKIHNDKLPLVTSGWTRYENTKVDYVLNGKLQEYLGSLAVPQFKNKHCTSKKELVMSGRDKFYEALAERTSTVVSDSVVVSQPVDNAVVESARSAWNAFSDSHCPRCGMAAKLCNWSICFRCARRNHLPNIH